MWIREQINNTENFNHNQYRVFGFMVTLKILELEVIQPDGQIHYFEFGGVEYFQGITSWVGGDFHEESKEKTLEFMEKFQSFSDIPQELKVSWYKLFSIQLDGTYQADPGVIILCRNMNIRQKSLFAEKVWRKQQE